MMKTKQEILKSLEDYDTEKYPVHLYDELVVKGAEHPQKFILMGAWKTGTIKENTTGIAYIHESNKKYAFTKRWADHTPVGKNTWQYISDNIKTIKQQVPKIFPKEEPAIVKELVDRKGFGYIWALFTLHCIYPTEYPLYDQHVYRAYKYLLSDGKDNPDTATNTWAAYTSYRNYFLGLLKEHKMEYQIMDRAVWTFGKSVKIHKRAKHEKLPALFREESVFEDDWVHGFTLSDKAKSFWWQIDKEHNIHIRRNNIATKPETINQKDLERIVEYMRSKDWVNLANSVSKLGDGTEEEGLGKFIFEHINKNTTYAQLSSHLAAIFSNAGIWEYNGAKRGIQIKHIEDVEWENALVSCYVHGVYDVEE